MVKMQPLTHTHTPGHERQPFTATGQTEENKILVQASRSKILKVYVACCWDCTNQSSYNYAEISPDRSFTISVCVYVIYIRCIQYYSVLCTHILSVVHCGTTGFPIEVCNGWEVSPLPPLLNELYSVSDLLYYLWKKDNGEETTEKAHFKIQQMSCLKISFSFSLKT